MRAYKGFNKDLACTMGKGTYQYEVGKTYKEDAAKCAGSGFHCVEEPLEVLRWYRGNGARYCVVEAAGDINEDGYERIACTEMKILKEVNLQELGALECIWISEHPERKSSWVQKDKGIVDSIGIVVVRGKEPLAKGEKGSTIYLLKEQEDTEDIAEIGIYNIDGETYKANTYYDIGGERHDKK